MTGQGGKLRSHGGELATLVQRAKQRDSSQRTGVDQHSPSRAETAGGGGGKLQSHGGQRSHRGAEGKAERFPHRGLVPTSTH